MKSGPEVRIVRIIARLNIGGPAIQAITLTKRLEEYGYRTTLVRGVEERDEGNMDYLADELGVRPLLIPWMHRNPSWRDLPALLSLVRSIRRERPHVVHTHAAKGGTLGRVATVIAFPRRRSRPLLIHTYHGHSLSGYFSPRVARVFRAIEHVLGRFTDGLVAVSPEVRDELVAMHVAPAAKFEIVRLGFDLVPFTANGSTRRQMREAFRSELGIPLDARVVTLIARLVPIKRVDRFLRMAGHLAELPDIRFLIVGDGELREELKRSPDAVALGARLLWAGFHRHMPPVYFASEVIVQTSDNEGTPVALIEAQAAGVPVVSTRVGGTDSAVVNASVLCAPGDETALADAVRSILDRPDAAAASAQVAQQYVLSNFEIGRLVRDVARIYEQAHAGHGQ